MSMHMIRGVQVHGNSKKKKSKSKRLKAAQAEHDAWLRKMGVHPEQMKGKVKDASLQIPDYGANKSAIPTSDAIPGNGAKTKANEYTGDYIIGIGTMHKSNMVPVTRKEDAVEMAKMRRS